MLKQILILVISIAKVFSWYNNPLEHESFVPGDHGYHGVHNGQEYAKHFMNEWTVEVEGDEEVAQLIALELGYVYGGPVIGFPNTYSFLKYEHSKQRKTYSEHTRTLLKDTRIKWAEQLFAKSRVKRYSIPDLDASLERVKRIDASNETLAQTRAKTEVNRSLFNDELWAEQWYLHGNSTVPWLPHLDLNVLPVYAMGLNGRGVRVSVLSDGIEHTHTDLRGNYDSEISWDFIHNDPDPSPRPENLAGNSDGTRCAGDIAMTANNVKCGVGVAWGAKVGGVRMLDEQASVTDRIEGASIGYAWDKVDIYTVPWGPDDNGRVVDGPGRLAMQAIKRGITQGRGGKGIIYVWPTGVGGRHHDNCNCDGYTSSIFTVSIGSASENGSFPWYGEVCTSTLAVAYSSGDRTQKKIATTNPGDKCTLSHTGTSASASLAAGIIALALEANPNLTWRDVQHLIVWTSECSPLEDNPGWLINDVGLYYNIRFGFGVLNAAALVRTALNWVTVPEKNHCTIQTSPTQNNLEISPERSAELKFSTNGCLINYVEHVELTINIRYNKRGALEVYLLSPSGTLAQLLTARPEDSSSAGFTNWALLSVATWGENPHGDWTAVIKDSSGDSNSGTVGPVTLTIHGTKDTPSHMKHLTKGTKKLDADSNVSNDIISDVVPENQSLTGDLMKSTR